MATVEVKGFPGAGLRGVRPVILSAAKDLFGRLARSFAALRMTGIISKCLFSSRDVRQ